ncbi:wall-associated receptor kinase-like 10 [Cornus florida]|uniref:wall-associated receptor kinase-like 10 n=1 Tax=Cornus florida TaxID=4283 RepID=UPI00289A0F8D|nr:wall-associated receptor kinase-like 10 [Cornus florida]
MVIELMVLVLAGLTGGASSASLPIAKPGCPDTCGNITIPYPFGIGVGCYADKSFAIACDNSSKAYFTSNKLPVLYIDMFGYMYSNSSGTIGILHPVLAYNCPNGSSHPLVNLSSHFWFSYYDNYFRATGCNNLALMMRQDQQIIGGCTSTCNPNISTDEGSCYGIKCCQTSIPPFLNFINTSLTRFINDNSKECNYAFITSSPTSINASNTSLINDMQEMKPVFDAMLEWGMPGECNEYSPANNTLLCGPNAFCRPGSNFTHRCSCNFTGGYSDRDPNPYLSGGCPGPPADKKKIRITIIVISTGFGSLLLFVGTRWLYKLVKRRKKLRLKRKFFKRNGGLLLQQQLSSADQGYVEKTKVFILKELEKATDHFNDNRILGQGGQGTVYKGMLIDGRIVAVKKSKIVDEGNLEQFINEVVILSQINHRNVVNLYGCCLESEVPLLVYEYIPNGTLYQYIHEQNEEFPLTWDIRVRIAAEVSGALAYLHSATSIPIYHRDIKSTNILLDDKFRAKVSDFGASRSIAIDQTHMTIIVQGTFGYLDPEYFQSSQFTEKSDVYSFGVVLVELLTGQQPISSTRSEERSLATYFMLIMKENCLFDILDARVSKEVGKENIIRVANLAKRCLNLSGRKRPTMKEVATELEGIRISHEVCTVQQNYEEDEYAVLELTGPWDVASTLTGSHLHRSASSSRDVASVIELTGPQDVATTSTGSHFHRSASSSRDVHPLLLK